MQSIILKFKAPSNKDLLTEYTSSNQFYNGYIMIQRAIDFIRDFEKNTYMDLVKLSRDENEKAVYYSEGVLTLDFTMLIVDIEYFNELLDKGKKLLNHKIKDKYNNDGIFITEPQYYLKEKIIYGYELKYPEHLMNEIKIVKKFIMLLNKEDYYRKEKKDKILKEISESLKLYDVKLIYNLERSETDEEDDKNEVYINDTVKLNEIIKNDWYYLINNISFNSVSEIYYQKGRIVFDFRKLKSDLTYINILQSEKDFLYEEGKPYLFKTIKSDPCDYIYLYSKDGYMLDEFEKEYGINKKIKIFFEELKIIIRYNEVNDFKNSKESEKAYHLALNALLKFKVGYKNSFNRKVNFFIEELMFPITAIVFTIGVLIYLVMYLYSNF